MEAVHLGCPLKGRGAQPTPKRTMDISTQKTDPYALLFYNS